MLYCKNHGRLQDGSSLPSISRFPAGALRMSGLLLSKTERSQARQKACAPRPSFLQLCSFPNRARPGLVSEEATNALIFFPPPSHCSRALASYKLQLTASHQLHARLWMRLLGSGLCPQPGPRYSRTDMAPLVVTSAR